MASLHLAGLLYLRYLPKLLRCRESPAVCQFQTCAGAVFSCVELRLLDLPHRRAASREQRRPAMLRLITLHDTNSDWAYRRARWL